MYFVLSIVQYCIHITKRRIWAFLRNFHRIRHGHFSASNHQEPVYSYFQQINKINTELLVSTVKFRAANLITLVWEGNLNERNSKRLTYSVTLQTAYHSCKSLSTASTSSLPESFCSQYTTSNLRKPASSKGRKPRCLYLHILCLPREEGEWMDWFVRLDVTPLPISLRTECLWLVAICEIFKVNWDLVVSSDSLMVCNPCAQGLRWVDVT